MKGEGIDRDELAILLGVGYDQATEILLAEVGDGLDCRSRVNGEGIEEWNLADVRQIAERRRRDPRTFTTRRSLSKERRPSHASIPPAPKERDPLPPEVRFSSGPDGILFSDEQGGSSGRQSTAGILLSDAAEQAGLTEDQMTTRVLGRARMKVVDGQMVVSKADLNRLADDGAIPKPSDRAKVDAMVAEAEGKPTRNASVEAKTDRMERALGARGGEDRKVADRTAKVAASLGVEGMDKPDQGKHKPESRSGVITAKADDRKPYRLGAPRRWSER
jgi:hypothetical protein